MLGVFGRMIFGFSGSPPSLTSLGVLFGVSGFIGQCKDIGDNTLNARHHARALLDYFLLQETIRKVHQYSAHFLNHAFKVLYPIAAYLVDFLFLLPELELCCPITCATFLSLLLGTRQI